MPVILETHVLKLMQHPFSNLRLAKRCLFAKRERDIVIDGERIKQGAALKQKAELLS